jgi:hypothetical protein
MFCHRAGKKIVKKKYDYIEGPKARENFERLAKALFQVPKKRPKKAAKPHRSSGSGKG